MYKLSHLFIDRNKNAKRYLEKLKVNLKDMK